MRSLRRPVYLLKQVAAEVRGGDTGGPNWAVWPLAVGIFRIQFSQLPSLWQLSRSAFSRPDETCRASGKNPK